MTTTIALLAHLAGAALSAQPSPALRIVVIEGEDAVNVIQQKTAVAPVVEIRDRNNLPVAGATVTFTIGGNTASFAGGLQTITVATNAAGQAAAVAINPIASGAVQIQVAAAFQGQAAAATIAQTNVLTAAQAATAAGATSAGASSGSTGGSAAAGGAAGGGGGVSGTTIGIVGAAVAGGTLAATQAGGEESTPATTSTGPRIFRGTFASTLFIDFQVCDRTEAVTGTLEITVRSAEPFSADARVFGGTSRVETVACTTIGPQPGSTGNLGLPPTPVTGTAADFGFTSEIPNTFPPSGNDPGGINVTGFRFAGALNGDEITGTLTHSRRIEGGGPPGVGSVSMAITLR